MDCHWTRIAILVIVNGVVTMKMLLSDLLEIFNKSYDVSLSIASIWLGISSKAALNLLCYVDLVLSSYKIIIRKKVENGNLVWDAWVNKSEKADDLVKLIEFLSKMRSHLTYTAWYTES